MATTATRTPPTEAPEVPRAQRSLKNRTHVVARWLHVYASMVALVVVLFFGITGLTLNHPDWFSSTTSQTSTGTFPFATRSDGAVAWLPIAEYVRTTYDVKGTVDSFEVTGSEGSIEFKNPGYSAALFFDVDTGSYDLTVEQQGFVAVMNDLHKGRDAGSSWRWTIDAAAVFLVAIAVTGLTMQFFLRKRRRSALIASAVGGVVLVVLVVLTLR